MNGAWLWPQAAPSADGNNGHEDSLGPLGKVETVMERCAGCYGAAEAGGTD